MRLAGRLVAASQVTRDERDCMFALMDQHYEQMARAAFEADLDEKHWVIQLLDPETGTLCGFSTQMLLEVAAAGRPITALFSGDTIIARDRWGDSALAHVWGHLALSLIDAFPETDLYWFLISKGYRTYRFLPVFFHEFYPRHDVPTSTWAREALDALSRHKYPAQYDAAAGVVRADRSHYYLRKGVADITPERARDPHVQFFAERNPGHVWGDELCCLAPLTRANFTPAAYRVIGPEPGSVGLRESLGRAGPAARPAA
jgi:hypothetical protein